MSESAEVSAGLVTATPERKASHEMAIAPEETLDRLADVLEVSGDPGAFDEAFVEFARGLTGARAAMIYREADESITVDAITTLPGVASAIASQESLAGEVMAVLQDRRSRRTTIIHGGTKYAVLCGWLEGDNDRPAAVLVLMMGPDRAPFAGPVFTIEHLLTRIFGERARVLESESWKKGFLQSTVLVDLFSRASMAPTMREAVSLIAEEFREFVGCARVAIGLGAGSRCQVESLSGFAKIEDRSHGTRMLRTLMREALGIGKPIVWPPPESSDSPLWPATDQGELLESLAAEQVLTLPLRTADDEEIGAWMFVFKKNDPLTEPKRELIEAAEPHAAALLELVRQSKPKGVRGFFHRHYFRASKNKKTTIWSIAILLAGLMALPLPYRIKSGCEVQPLQLRQVAAPFDGRLEDVFVKPGEQVEKDALLAQLDGKELSWRLAQAVSEREIALKKRDVAQSSETNPADALMAQLEADAAALEVDLLKYQQNNLEIRAPNDGFVLSGNLERSKGVPVTMGQKLFDIAPSTTMRLEISVPDSEIRWVEEGQPVTVRLEAQPRKKYEAEIEEIYPVSEIEDGKNVFICLATMENPDGELRPGMRGKARVSTGLRPFGWILFHKPIDFLRLHL